MGPEGHVAIWWVRHDFRLADNPALHSAIDDGEAVLPLFVLDPHLLATPNPGQGHRMLHNTRASLPGDHYVQSPLTRPLSAHTLVGHGKGGGPKNE